MRRYWLPLLLLALSPQSGATSPIVAPITAVTLYSDRATVTRSVTIALAAGHQQIELTHLPGRLDEGSIRLSATASGEMTINGLELQRHFGDTIAAPQEQDLTQQLQAAEDERELLRSRLKALESQARFIDNLSQLPTSRDRPSPLLQSPSEWADAWQVIGQGMSDTLAAQLTINQQIRQLNQLITRLQQQLQQLRTGRRDTLSARIDATMATASEATFHLSYQIHGAHWQPVYDAHLESRSATLTITQGAVIEQRPGEDWHGVALTLSTARPAAGTSMAELAPWWIELERLQPRMAEEAATSRMMMAPVMLEGNDLAIAASETAPRVEVGDFAVTYHVAGPVSLVADGRRQRLHLAQFSLPAQLSGRTTPRVDPNVWLHVASHYNGTATLLAGEWHLYRDGALIGKELRTHITPASPLALDFGVDDNVVVKSHLLRDERGQKGLFQRSQRLVRDYRFELTNRHPRAISITVYDQLPVARDKEIKVELLEGSTQPLQRDSDNRAGVMQWAVDLAAEQQQTLRFGYSVEYPEGRNLNGL
jgi:uncharacterized protein (TIGR02231 family)